MGFSSSSSSSSSSSPSSYSSSSLCSSSLSSFKKYSTSTTTSSSTTTTTTTTSARILTRTKFMVGLDCDYLTAPTPTSSITTRTTTMALKTPATSTTRSTITKLAFRRMPSSLFANTLFISFMLWIHCFFSVITPTMAQSAAHVQLRVYEQVDTFMTRPITALKVWEEYYRIGGFPNNMNAPDRDLVAKYLYTMTTSSTNEDHDAVSHNVNDYWKPYYALDNGLFLVYTYPVPGSAISVLSYREPGESGYSSNDFDKVIYRNSCVDYYSGDSQPCIMTAGSSYISCINNCELVKCKNEDTQRNCSSSSSTIQQDVDNDINGAFLTQENCDANVTWCKNYSIEQTEEYTQLGYIPISDYCYDSTGVFSQTPGEILVTIESGEVGLGDCTFGSGAFVNRQLFGPYANCGGNGETCDTTYVGAYASGNYDPRWRGWYIDTKAAQKNLWSKPYAFFTGEDIGMTYTHPIYNVDEQGRKIFVGTLAADLLLGDISDYLVETFGETEFDVAIYDTTEPHAMIGLSTGSPILESVSAEDPTQPCSEEQSENGECTLVQLTIHTLDATPADVVLSNAHTALEKDGFDSNRIVHVKERDDVFGTAYLATFVLYEQPDANLIWRIIVTLPLERDPENYIDEDEFIYTAIFVLGILGFLICGTLVIMFFSKRTERAVVLADFKFTSAFVFWCAFLNLTSITLLGENTDDMCMLRMWVYYTLSSMALSPLFVKAFRTWTLLGTPPSLVGSRNKMNNCEAWIRTLPIPFVQIAILATFTVVDPPKATEEIIYDGPLPTQSITCKHEHSKAFSIIQLTFYSILVVTGCILAYLTRNIDPKFADSKALVFAMYNIAFTLVMFGAIFSLVEIPVSGISMMTSIGIFWVTVFSSLVFVVPKLAQAKSDKRKTKQQMMALRASQAAARPVTKRYSSGCGISADSIHDSDDSLKILICSANMGNAEPTLSSMKAWIPDGGYTSYVKTLDKFPIEAEQFDLIVIGMQESTWSSKSKKRASSDMDSVDLEDAGGSLDKEDNMLAAVEGTDTVTLRRMEKTILGDDYNLVAEELRGQMRMYIWALKAVTPFLENIKISGANTGIGNVLANKGGIVVSLKYQNTRFSFLSAHLAAHEGESYYRARCENVYDILKNSKTDKLSQKIDTSLSSHHMFVFGDLNFRTKFEPGTEHEESVHRALQLIKDEDFNTLYSYDELHKGVKKGDLLADFETLPCNFYPTFKVEREAGFVYKEQRTPSYTDRILYKSGKGIGSFLKPIAYEPCVDFITSDHKPIRGAFSIITNEMMDPIDLEWRFRMVFRDMECSDLPSGDVDGYSDPFLMFIWDGIELTEGKRRRIRLPRFLPGGTSRFPRTGYVSKTLNPKWTGQEMVLMSLEDRQISNEATLYLSVFDFDFGAKDDVLGTLALNLQELVLMKPGKIQKEVEIDEPLRANGKYAGRIKCKVEISAFIG